MGNEPTLPEPFRTYQYRHEGDRTPASAPLMDRPMVPLYTAEQMQEYARSAIAASGNVADARSDDEDGCLACVTCGQPVEGRGRVQPPAQAEPSEAALAEGAHVLSEWLNDGAPIGERRYLEPLRAALKAMRELPADHPIRRLF